MDGKWHADYICVCVCMCLVWFKTDLFRLRNFPYLFRVSVSVCVCIWVSASLLMRWIDRLYCICARLRSINASDPIDDRWPIVVNQYSFFFGFRVLLTFFCVVSTMCGWLVRALLLFLTVFRTLNFDSLRFSGHAIETSTPRCHPKYDRCQTLHWRIYD